jgi:hypothetical protein
MTAAAEHAQERLVEKLPTQFFLMAKHDAPLAIAMHALCDLIEDGCFREAYKLNQAIATRLELLAVTRQD